MKQIYNIINPVKLIMNNVVFHKNFPIATEFTMNEEKKKSSLRIEIDKAVSVIRTHTETETPIAIILGTGLGKLAETIKTEIVIPYGDIPGFPISTVESHQGKLIIGKLGGKSVVAMQGGFITMKDTPCSKSLSRCAS